MPLDEAPMTPDKGRGKGESFMSFWEDGREKPSLGLNRANTSTESLWDDRHAPSPIREILHSVQNDKTAGSSVGC